MGRKERELVLGQTESADDGGITDTGMWPMPVAHQDLRTPKKEKNDLVQNTLFLPSLRKIKMLRGVDFCGR